MPKCSFLSDYVASKEEAEAQLKGAIEFYEAVNNYLEDVLRNVTE